MPLKIFQTIYHDNLFEIKCLVVNSKRIKY